MRSELWGLRDKETNELVLEYWASSQKHKALFSSYDRAQKACNWKHNMHLEPFKIEPAIDAVPVKHGKWIRMDNDGEAISECSVCKFPVSTFWNESNYCPNCGAKMDLEDKI